MVFFHVKKRGEKKIGFVFYFFYLPAKENILEPRILDGIKRLEKIQTFHPEIWGQKVGKLDGLFSTT